MVLKYKIAGPFTEVLLFPSPYGDVVLKFSWMELFRNSYPEFPSPYGDVFLKVLDHFMGGLPEYKFPSPYGDVVLK